MSMLTVEAHRKRFTVKATPMQPLSAVVVEVLGQLRLEVRPEDCKLMLRGKTLDLATPVRFANIGRDKLELHTGHEPLLGVQDTPKPAAPAPLPTTAGVPLVSSAPHPRHQAPAEGPAVSASPTVEAAPGINVGPASTVPSQSAAAPAATAPSEPREPAPAAAAVDRSGSGSVSETDNVHPSAAVFGRRVWVFTRSAEQQAESGVGSGGGAEDLDDSFYEFTEMDLRRAMASQSAQRAKQEGAHLMTAAMREREEMRRAEGYGSVPIRLYLPDAWHCLQTSLPATAPLSSVLQLARASLIPEAAAGAYLFTTPPRVVLREEQLSLSLYAAKMVPAAKLHVGVDASKAPAGGQLIKPEVLALVEQPPQRAAVMHSNKPSSQQGQPQGAGGGTAAGHNGGSAAPARAGGTGAKGVPKWLKLGK